MFEEMAKLKGEGYTMVKELSRDYNLSYVGMRRILLQNGVEPDREIQRGKRIYYLYDAKKTERALKKLGYTRRGDIKNG